MIIKVLEKRIKETGKETVVHSYYVEKYAKDITDIAIKRGFLKENEKDIFHTCARYHDIGKSMIPKNILYNKGKLSPKQFNIIKKHIFFGKILVQEYKNEIPKEYFKPLLDTVELHHVKENGGYPMGIKINQIPHIVKLVSICDSLSAMTMNRCYHKGISIEDAIKKLENENPRKFSNELISIIKETFGINTKK